MESSTEQKIPLLEKKMTLPSLLLFNTETRQKEILRPADEHCVRMYTCGPTVYNYAHIGNFRTYVFEDLLRRTIKYFGMDVEQVMNLTDVDDKTIRGATEEGKSLDEYTKTYKKAFFDDLGTLGIEKVEHYPAATDYIPEMIEMIQQLMEKGIAYQGADGSVYYSIRKFGRYGCLSKLNLEELQEGASERVASDEYEKDSASDFVLWKGYDSERDGSIFWESPFGPGRPGWHLECSAMAMKILGETIDLHVGGVDNIFPHHENEIAQSEACSGKTFARMWAHSEHLIVDNKKMSKSLGNFYTLRDLLDKGFTGRQVRYLLLQVHYRTQLNFTLQGLEAAKQSLDRLDAFVRRIHEMQKENKSGSIPDSLEEILEKREEEFKKALGDDLNISVALAALFELVREVNFLSDQGEMSAEGAQKVEKALQSMDQVIGIMDFQSGEERVPQEILDAVEKRKNARKNKDWALADEMRDFIQEQGYVLEDTAQGTRVVRS